jgi:hypothetical protein
VVGNFVLDKVGFPRSFLVIGGILNLTTQHTVGNSFFVTVTKYVFGWFRTTPHPFILDFKNKEGSRKWHASIRK